MKLFNTGVFMALAACAAALDPVEVKGNALFVKGSSDRFYIRGVDYQPGGSSKLTDPLADTSICERDIKYFKDLGINTVRVYSVDNTADHDECMQQLADAGIYVIVDVNIPNASISRDKAKCSYNTMYLEQVLATVKMMAKYDNTLGFFAGNEVINDESSTAAATYVKAVIRDMKQFIKNTDLRAIPVGYSAADVSENRLETAQFFNCGDDEMARSDWFGFNDYSWCGKSSYTTSGYDQKVKAYSNYSIPLFLSEFGCNKATPRPFSEIEAIYSDKMSPVFSGGLVYEYSEEGSKYGLVKIDGDDVTTNQDFDNLKSEYSNTKNPSGDGGYHTDLEYSECPAKSSSWNATSDLPPAPKGAYKFINGTADPQGGGFKASTQWACIAKGNDDDDSKGATRSGSKKFRRRSFELPIDQLVEHLEPCRCCHWVQFNLSFISFTTR
ncbi:glycoside hydrolase family 72 protein [Suhomyces tanzawaensis NRRL Y-17324]|uniref:1,3-beta-glucanosyltransferase n=1 Tax=Suhomyces tanzawaensis NRRL Y-17324 TaxID=984487 RepID=A0A1E4SLF0_9ASCO|nr:glycoside hydrolase family 72 protein [Suhomyces tanzawaensis NRRL Y-17324]ODV80320.1 glycoside hydrolase family 72 protein [Suhomyces tanzawaensis NRRL Y-17324]